MLGKLRFAAADDRSSRALTNGTDDLLVSGNSAAGILMAPMPSRT